MLCPCHRHDERVRAWRPSEAVRQPTQRETHPGTVTRRPLRVLGTEKSQAFLGPKGYKIIVVDYVSCAILFKGNVDEYDKAIYLIKHGDHFNGLRSMIAFLNRSYLCPDCCKGYNTEDAANHSYVSQLFQLPKSKFPERSRRLPRF